MNPEKSANQDEEKGNVAKAVAPGPSASDDPSSKMWALCISHVDRHDPSMVERWKSDMDGILIYTGVFCTTVAAFLIEAYKTLKPDPSEISSRLLRQATQELAFVANGERYPFPTADPSESEPFEPKRWAVHVNILWFLSLCLSLFCGLIALLVQQWVRRYLRLIQRADTPLRRVRVRTFLFDGMQDFHIRWVVENVSVLLHAAIFLFFAGLVEFLFAVNNEVAHVILAVVCVFAVVYIVITALPVIYRQCPFQTPLTSGLWYLSRIISIISLSPCTFSSHVRTKIDGLWGQVYKGIDKNLTELVEHRSALDKSALKSTLSMCRDESDVEAFVDAIPGYLQVDQNVGSRIDDIISLGRPGCREVPLGTRIVHLFSTCIHGRGRMDETHRRRRAIACARAVWELSRVFLSVKGVTLELPRSLGNILQRLSRDLDPTIAFTALSTTAVLERALLEQLSDAEAKKDADRIQETTEVLAEAVGENDPLSPRYLAGLRNDNRSDGRLVAVTEFISSMLALVPRLESPSRRSLEETRMTLQELCRELNGRTFSPAAQGRFVDVLSRAWKAHLAAGSTGRHSHPSPTRPGAEGHIQHSYSGYSAHSSQTYQCGAEIGSGSDSGDPPPTETYHSTIISSTQILVLTLGPEYIETLRERGFVAS